MLDDNAFVDVCEAEAAGALEGTGEFGGGGFEVVGVGGGAAAGDCCAGRFSSEAVELWVDVDDTAFTSGLLDGSALP